MADQIPVTMSTTSAYPLRPAEAFEIAARLGYDGLEVMVLGDPITQNIDKLRELSERHGMPIHSIHAPTLLVTPHVFGTSPWGKIDRSIDMAHRLGAKTVVLHPPFRWQRDYAATFVEGVAQREAEHPGIRLAVENMFPWRAGADWKIYLPGYDPVPMPYSNVTVDLSHASVSRSDVLAMQEQLGSRLAHVHLCDGSGSSLDEHLVPGRGKQPCAEFLRRVGASDFDGIVCLEVGTRKLKGEARDEALRESLEFARRCLAEGAAADAR